MVNIISTQTFESKVAPGVTFTLRRLSKMHTAMRDRSIQKDLIEYRFACIRTIELIRKAGYTVSPDGSYQRTSEEPIAPEVEAEITRLDDEIATRLRAVIMPASIKASLLSIEGITVDEVPVKDAETLLNAGPQANELIKEIYDCSETANQLTAEEKEIFGRAA